MSPGLVVTAAPAGGTLIEELRLFPLPNLVFFPHTLQALHIFEPRYRALVKDAVAGDRRLALVLLRPGWEPQYYGAPPIRDVATLGEIARFDELEDGRANVLLRGLCRVRVLDELKTTREFRTARAEVLDRIAERDPLDLARELSTVRQLFAALVARIPGLSLGQASALYRPEADAGMVIDAIASALPLDPDAKQDLLEEMQVSVRAARLAGLLVNLSDAGPESAEDDEA